jgi:5-formyltetrahydrofolate cyclo-ligase
MHINLQGSKAELRSEMKTKRAQLEAEQIQHDSIAIARRLNDLLPVQKASTIMGLCAYSK